MTVSQEIIALDEIAASLRAIASRAVKFDPKLLDVLADQVGRAPDRAQGVSELRAALALLTTPVAH